MRANDIAYNIKTLFLPSHPSHSRMIALRGALGCIHHEEREDSLSTPTTLTVSKDYFILNVHLYSFPNC